jgi:hypothetical protein
VSRALQRFAWMRRYDLVSLYLRGRGPFIEWLEEVARRLRVEQAAQREVDAELEALRASTARLWDLVLDGADGPLLWRCCCPRRQSYSRAILMPQSLTGFAGVPDRHWLLPCCTSRSWKPSWSCYGLGTTWTWRRIKWTPSGPKRAWPQTRWHHMSFLRLPAALLMVRGRVVVVVCVSREPR